MAQPESVGAMWLASYADGVVRGHLDGAPGDRGRLRLPPLAFIRSRLVQQGGEGFDARMLHCLAMPKQAMDAWEMYGEMPSMRAAPVTALLKVSTRDCHHHSGVLTAWNEEAELQRMFFHNPLDSYTLSVEDVKICLCANSLTLKEGRHRGEGGVARISATQPLFTGAWRGVSDDGDDADLDVAAQVRLRRVGRQVGPAPEGEDVPTVAAAATLRAWGVQGQVVE